MSEIKRNRSDLKKYFQKTLIPTEKQFAELIDSSINIKEDGIDRPPGRALRIESDETGRDSVLELYQDFDDTAPQWTFGLRTTAKSGLTIKDGGGITQLFIEAGEDGKVGIGTAAPQAKLDVAGDAIVDGDITLTGEMKKTLAWKPLNLTVAWRPDTTIYSPPSYCRDAAGIVRVRGAIHWAATPKVAVPIVNVGFPVGILDEGYRPDYTIYFQTAKQSPDLAYVHLEVSPGGQILMFLDAAKSAVNATSVIFLDGLAFHPAA